MGFCITKENGKQRCIDYEEFIRNYSIGNQFLQLLIHGSNAKIVNNDFNNLEDVKIVGHDSRGKDVSGSYKIKEIRFEETEPQVLVYLMKKSRN